MSETLKRILNLGRNKSTDRVPRSPPPVCCKLYHFPIRDKAESIRYMLAYLVVPYEDVQISFEEFNTSDMSKDTPFGQLPVFQADGKKISGTLPILKYIARTYHICPKSNYQEALADMYGEILEKLAEELLPVNRAAYIMRDDEKKSQEWNKYKKNHLLPMMTKLEENIGKKKYLCGDRITWVDLMMAEFIDRIDSLYEENILPKMCPNLWALKNKIQQTAPLKMYILYRKKMEY
uniref:Glutathione S-transferase n=1 Tax=Romanomermis culicivorax TaxID=13658 RepID=A0A915J6D4_ROMCU